MNLVLCEAIPVQGGNNEWVADEAINSAGSIFEQVVLEIDEEGITSAALAEKIEEEIGKWQFMGILTVTVLVEDGVNSVFSIQLDVRPSDIFYLIWSPKPITEE
jgi:hypothetical protein